jgi:deoxyribose-phosphate aldolase
LNQYIDQTLLKPEATETEVRTFLEGVKKYDFYAVFLHPCWVEMARKELPEGKRIGSVVGFPLGASSMKTKAFAADDLVKMGCAEIDMVMNIGRMKSGDHKYVGRDIKGVVSAAAGRVVKVIIETCLLTGDEKISACRIVKESGARFVKTSTGFSKDGACIDDVRRIRAAVGPDFGVKASGGIRDYATVMKFMEAGANRIGTSAGVAIMEEFLKRSAGTISNAASPL